VGALGHLLRPHDWAPVSAGWEVEGLMRTVVGPAQATRPPIRGDRLDCAGPRGTSLQEAAPYARDLDLRAGAEHAIRVPGEAAGSQTSNPQRMGATDVIA
jgi:hypothetical protein